MPEVLWADARFGFKLQATARRALTIKVPARSCLQFTCAMPAPIMR
jgi:hypothetical protein